MKTRVVKIGNIKIGGKHPLRVQTMCNTHTNDVEASVAQCVELAEAGAEMIRLTVPKMEDVENIAEIRRRLRQKGYDVPIIADVHFSSEIAIAVAEKVEKVRINPGNFNKDFEKAKEQFSKLISVCKKHNTAIRIGLNHGSLGERITNLYGNTPLAMKEAVMEWLELCLANEFYNVVVSLKASNTIVMVEAYRLLAKAMKKRKMNFPLHLGVTEAGNGDAGRIKSIVGISSLLKEGIGDTIRVSLTENPANEITVARYITDRLENKRHSSMVNITIIGNHVSAIYNAKNKEELLLDFAWDWGNKLLGRSINSISLKNLNEAIGQNVCDYLSDELMQAARRKFYRPEYIACPGCGRTMFNLEASFEKVKERTSHLQGMVIAVMGCIVNGPGEMADADWGYVGEGNGMVSIYQGKEAILRHVPEDEAIDELLRLIDEDSKAYKVEI